MKNTLSGIMMIQILLAASGCVPVSHVQMLTVPGVQAPEPPSPVMALQGLAETLAEQLAVNVATNSNLAIAVSVSSSAGAGGGNIKDAVAEKLKSAMFRTGKFTVIEDPQMDAVLAQYRVQDELRALLNGGKAPEIGALAKVQGVVLCSLIDMGSEWAVQCRLIPLKTGTWVGTAEGRLSKTSVEPAKVPARKPSYLGTMYYGDDGLEMIVTAVTRSKANNTLRIRYAFYNGGDRNACVELVNPQQQAYIADAAGNTFPFLGSEGFVGQELSIRPGSRVECTLIFRMPVDVVAFAKIFVEWDMGGRWGGNRRNFVLNVPSSALQ
jgi:hypothetical protein